MGNVRTNTVIGRFAAAQRQYEIGQYRLGADVLTSQATLWSGSCDIDSRIVPNERTRLRDNAQPGTNLLEDGRVGLSGTELLRDDDMVDQPANARVLKLLSLVH